MPARDEYRPNMVGPSTRLWVSQIDPDWQNQSAAPREITGKDLKRAFLAATDPAAPAARMVAFCWLFVRL